MTFSCFHPKREIVIGSDIYKPREFCAWLNKQGHDAKIGNSTESYIDGYRTDWRFKGLWEEYCNQLLLEDEKTTWTEVILSCNMVDRTAFCKWLNENGYVAYVGDKDESYINGAPCTNYDYWGYRKLNRLWVEYCNQKKEVKK